VNFSSREDDHAILIYKLEPTTGMLRTRAYIGQHMPLYCSAMGKIYMAFGHPDYVESYWKPPGYYSAADPQYHYRLTCDA
jgi:DNA-binding IclR family transcriptional regulator